MFSRYFARDQVSRYQASPHKARIDHVASCLVARKYLDVVIADHVREWLRLTTYLDARALPLPSCSGGPDVQAYVAQRVRFRSASRARFVRATARIFLETDEQGYIRRRIGTAIHRPPPAWFEPVMHAYTWCLQRARGLADRTVSKRTWQLTQIAEFLEREGVGAITGIQACHLQQFFTQLKGQKPATRLTYGVTLRSFLRWAYRDGRLPLDLSAAVITTRHFRQAGVRDVLSDDEMTRVLATADRSNAIGRRDFAVLLLAARYGMRPSDIRQLRLEDVHWREGVIAIRQAKTGNPLVLPLLPDVIMALAAYVRHGRPTTDARQVFVRHRAPFEPFVAGNNLSQIMWTALRRAGLSQRPGRHGLYLLRHTFATRLLAAGCPMKTIGDLMGHVSTDTTREYANVDLVTLRRVALSEAEVQA
ncbi:MAG: site-specific integrase [Vicinamibacterales bacterium]